MRSGGKRGVVPYRWLRERRGEGVGRKEGVVVLLQARREPTDLAHLHFGGSVVHVADA
jgi:hypothetical protein